MQIQFDPSEFLVEISGRTGPYGVRAVIGSLVLVTNLHSYGPFGFGGQIPFRTSVQDNGSIIGFFGRSGQFLHAIGVYVNPNRFARVELEALEEGVDKDDNVCGK